MSTRRSAGSRPPRTTISYVVRDRDEPRHRSGINAAKLGPKGRVLFTAGRDSIIRSWNVGETRVSDSIDFEWQYEQFLYRIHLQNQWNITRIGSMTLPYVEEEKHVTI